MQAVGKAVVLAAVLVTAACTATREPSPAGVIEPSYVFAIGANKSDVLGMLGVPQAGPRFDRYSNLTEVTYSYPFRAVQAESRLKDGTTRVEMVDTIHFFFNQKNLVERMAFRTDRYYPSFTDFPVHKVTILPRLIDRQGRVRPVADASHSTRQAEG
ncbi:hypothetical protein FZ983_29110 [Azospirillum sp. B21]|nr:hypothetical protein FZ983_29110 [Azospirillum sp. B21]